MSRKSIHPLTKASIRVQGLTGRRDDGAVVAWSCGCELRNGLEGTTGKWWLCGYHEGFEDGIEARGDGR